MGRADRKRIEYRCGLCGTYLGPDPWLGQTPDLYTACGCYPPPNNGKTKMIRKPSPQEKVQAILDARQNVAEYLGSIGKLDAFATFTKDEICGLIRAAQEGVQASLHRQLDQALEDEIPF